MPNKNTSTSIRFDPSIECFPETVGTKFFKGKNAPVFSCIYQPDEISPNEGAKSILNKIKQNIGKSDLLVSCYDLFLYGSESIPIINQLIKQLEDKRSNKKFRNTTVRIFLIEKADLGFCDPKVQHNWAICYQIKTNINKKPSITLDNKNLTPCYVSGLQDVQDHRFELPLNPNNPHVRITICSAPSYIYYSSADYDNDDKEKEVYSILAGYTNKYLQNPSDQKMPLAFAAAIVDSENRNLVDEAKAIANIRSFISSQLLRCVDNKVKDIIIESNDETLIRGAQKEYFSLREYNNQHRNCWHLGKLRKVQFVFINDRRDDSQHYISLYACSQDIKYPASSQVEILKNPQNPKIFTTKDVQGILLRAAFIRIFMLQFCKEITAIDRRNEQACKFFLRKFTEESKALQSIGQPIICLDDSRQLTQTYYTAHNIIEVTRDAFKHGLTNETINIVHIEAENTSKCPLALDLIGSRLMMANVRGEGFAQKYQIYKFAHSSAARSCTIVFINGQLTETASLSRTSSDANYTQRIDTALCKFRDIDTPLATFIEKLNKQKEPTTRQNYLLVLKVKAINQKINGRDIVNNVANHFAKLLNEKGSELSADFHILLNQDTYVYPIKDGIKETQLQLEFNLLVDYEALGRLLLVPEANCYALIQANKGAELKILRPVTALPI